MIIDQEKCTRCAKCLVVCPVNAIVIDRTLKKVVIDQELCVECNVCYRSAACEHDAWVVPVLEWPRSVRRAFSDPLFVHEQTRIPGRGTEEMKTNDVTGRFGRGQVGIAIELGRPGISATFHDIQMVTMTCARHGVSFEPKNPVTCLLADRSSGAVLPEILNERVLSAIVEFELDQSAAAAVLRDLRAVSADIDTVFSLNACLLLDLDDTVPGLAVLEREGFHPSPNGKTNVGLGRPAYDFWGDG